MSDSLAMVTILVFAVSGFGLLGYWFLFPRRLKLSDADYESISRGRAIRALMNAADDIERNGKGEEHVRKVCDCFRDAASSLAKTGRTKGSD